MNNWFKCGYIVQVTWTAMVQKISDVDNQFELKNVQDQIEIPTLQINSLSVSNCHNKETGIAKKGQGSASDHCFVLFQHG